MEENLIVKPDLIIAGHEIEVTASRAGGPGGQHVNKTSTRITVRWNLVNTSSLLPEQKARVLEKLTGQLTTSGDLVVHNSASRSQQQNKAAALANLAQIIRKALHVPKRRMKTRVPKAAKTKRLEAKSRHGEIKKLRSNKFSD